MSIPATAMAEHQPHHKRSSGSAAAPAAATTSDDDGGSEADDGNGSRAPPANHPHHHQRKASSSCFAAATTTAYQENTYLIGPRAHAEAAGSPSAAQALGVAPFDAAAARRALRAAILERVAATTAAPPSSSSSSAAPVGYDPLAAARMARRLAEDARQRLRALGYGRHKLIVQAAVGERKGQAVRCASRCLWGEGDGWASESYESDALYCVVQVHALYHE